VYPVEQLAKSEGVMDGESAAADDDIELSCIK